MLPSGFYERQGFARCPLGERAMLMPSKRFDPFWPNKGPGDHKAEKLRY